MTFPVGTSCAARIHQCRPRVPAARTTTGQGEDERNDTEKVLEGGGGGGGEQTTYIRVESVAVSALTAGGRAGLACCGTAVVLPWPLWWRGGGGAVCDKALTVDSRITARTPRLTHSEG